MFIPNLPLRNLSKTFLDKFWNVGSAVILTGETFLAHTRGPLWYDPLLLNARVEDTFPPTGRGTPCSACYYVLKVISKLTTCQVHHLIANIWFSPINKCNLCLPLIKYRLSLSWWTHWVQQKMNLQKTNTLVISLDHVAKPTKEITICQFVTFLVTLLVSSCVCALIAVPVIRVIFKLSWTDWIKSD